MSNSLMETNRVLGGDIEEEIDFTHPVDLDNDKRSATVSKGRFGDDPSSELHCRAWQMEQQDMLQLKSMDDVTFAVVQGQDHDDWNINGKKTDLESDISSEDDESDDDDADFGGGDGAYNDNDGDSCSRDSVLSAQARENQLMAGIIIGIIQGKIVNVFAACFRFMIDSMIAVYKWIIQKCSSSSSSDEEGVTDLAADLAEDAIDVGYFRAANNQFASGLGAETTPGNTTAMNPGVQATQQMATMAAQSAATATASSATAAAAAAASSSIASTLAGAVASVGVASQVGVAVGVAAVSIIAVVSTAVSDRMNSEGPTASTTFLGLDDTFIPPVCSPNMDIKQGYVELQIQSLPKEALPQHKLKMERMFRTLYNNISGQCFDPLQRVVHNASLERWEETDVDPQTTITTLYWQATVACSGCPDWEPLFDSSILLSSDVEIARDTMSNATANTTTITDSNVTAMMPSNKTNGTSPQSTAVTGSLNPEEQQLQQVPSLDEFFAVFATAFGFNLGPLLEEASDGAIIIEADDEGSPKVVFATTKAAPGFEGSNGTVSIGEAALEQFEDFVQTNNGNVQTPFITDDLTSLADDLS
ncbi:hypothetical protein SEMRO_742_G195990.1 [Seminavis robusta]|uniref:Uncharacterized protein n=1 Tax=Seminavis robusta TaxID=568900 RepID=A0A9N8E6Z0_9STRA|nr:hypothetical protein SEMRO_742_G195990.1 [Seminavis robusta]|eukprot:Sro742_g195990.1 n/a (589) ;mRNA; r:47924-49959